MWVQTMLKNTNSEELLEKYKRLIGTLKEKRSKFIVSGILPCIGAENQFYNKAFSTNDRLKSLCSKENVEFLTCGITSMINGFF